MRTSSAIASKSSAAAVLARQYLVPGSRALLEALRDRGLRLYLASGTDEVYMKDEADLLDVTRYFDGGVYGALDDPNSLLQAHPDPAHPRTARDAAATS